MARDLEADLKLCEAATKGPWLDCNNHIYDSRGRLLLVLSKNFKEMNCGDVHFIVGAREGWPETLHELIEARKQIRELQRKLRIEIGTHAAETRYMELILGEALGLPFYPDPDDGIDMTGRTTIGLCKEAANRIEQLQAIREKLESKE